MSASPSAPARRAGRPHQRDRGSRHGHIRAGADGDADIGLGQRRGVVDAVADHRDLLALALQFLDFGGFAARQDLGQHQVDAHLAGDGLGGLLVVAGEHRRPSIPSRCSSAMASSRAVFDGIGHGDHAAHLSVHRHQHGGLGFSLQALDLRFQTIEPEGQPAPSCADCPPPPVPVNFGLPRLARHRP